MLGDIQIKIFIRFFIRRCVFLLNVKCVHSENILKCDTGHRTNENLKLWALRSEREKFITLPTSYFSEQEYSGHAELGWESECCQCLSKTDDNRYFEPARTDGEELFIDDTDEGEEGGEEGGVVTCGHWPTLTMSIFNDNGSLWSRRVTVPGWPELTGPAIWWWLWCIPQYPDHNRSRINVILLGAQSVAALV